MLRFRALHASGAMSVSEIARETGLHRQTVRKYLSSQAPPGPPRGSSRQGTQARVVTEVAPLIDAMLRAELRRMRANGGGGGGRGVDGGGARWTTTAGGRGLVGAEEVSRPVAGGGVRGC
ncbi:helix-turn-helix domain-containing protein [Streptomyces sp. NPDC047453]|uniref:helix-turn-helix domain-containing protein n=1 Tax=Streptomyces sp. NPDC047453 TaxID=3154812 RepID=UPI003400F6AB